MGVATYLVKRAPGVPICNDTVQADLVEVRRLQLQHLVDARAVYFIRGLADVSVASSERPNRVVISFSQNWSSKSNVLR